MSRSHPFPSRSGMYAEPFPEWVVVRSTHPTHDGGDCFWEVVTRSDGNGNGSRVTP